MRLKKAWMQKRRSGMTLTELAIVLGATGLAMAGIWAIVGAVWNNYQAYKLNQQVMVVVQNVRDHYGPMGLIKDRTLGSPPNYTFADGADITAVLDDDDRRLIPIEMRLTQSAEGGGINHALAATGVSASTGSFRVESRNSGTAFRVRLLGLKRSNCIKLLMQFPLAMPEAGVLRVATQAQSTNVNALNIASPGGAVTLPMNFATANNWCNSGSDSNEVSLDFKLRR